MCGTGGAACLIVVPGDHTKALELLFFVGYKGGKIYWLAIHSNQANLIVGGLWSCFQPWCLQCGNIP
jgi:hypothetical protein